MALRGYDVPYASHRSPVTGFLCAAFIGWDRFLNPVLLGVLLIAVYLWVRRLLGLPLRHSGPPCVTVPESFS